MAAMRDSTSITSMIYAPQKSIAATACIALLAGACTLADSKEHATESLLRLTSNRMNLLVRASCVSTDREVLVLYKGRLTSLVRNGEEWDTKQESLPETSAFPFVAAVSPDRAEVACCALRAEAGQEEGTELYARNASDSQWSSLGVVNGTVIAMDGSGTPGEWNIAMTHGSKWTELQWATIDRAGTVVRNGSGQWNLDEIDAAQFNGRKTLLVEGTGEQGRGVYRCDIGSPAVLIENGSGVLFAGANGVALVRDDGGAWPTWLGNRPRIIEYENGARVSDELLPGTDFPRGGGMTGGGGEVIVIIGDDTINGQEFRVFVRKDKQDHFTERPVHW